MGKTLASLVPVLVLSGCMNSSLSPTSTMLTSNTGVVSVLGNKPADRDKVYATTLAEAAKLARTHGYQYFVILNVDDRSVTTPKYVLGQAIPYDFTGGTRRPLTAALLSPANMLGANLMGPGKTVSYVKPGLEITVKMYHQGEIDSYQEGVWNVDFIPDEAAIEP